MPLGALGRDEMSIENAVTLRIDDVEVTCVKDTFTLGGDDSDLFSGWHDPSQRWNGFATPMFDLQTVRKIASLIDRWAKEAPDVDMCLVEIDDAGQVFYVSDWGRDVIRPVVMLDGEPLWEIGMGAWTWQEMGGAA
mgnify:CR=1 FL=1